MIVELPYTLHTRYASIATAWTIILIPPIFINLGLFYSLWYGKPDMDRTLVLTLPTAILGIFTILAILERIYKLTKSAPTYRPLNSPRYALDIFQWGYFGALLLISSLITSTLARADSDEDNHEFQIRLLSLPAVVLMLFLAVLTLLSLALNALQVKLPFRFGSVEKGGVVRPAVFYVVEDVVAVDGEGGVEFREAFNARYEGSEMFRRMIWVVSVVWMVAFVVFGAGFAVLVLKLPVEAVYAVGWAGPFPLAGVVAIWTIFYVRSALRLERKMDGLEGGYVNGSSGQPGVPEDREREPLLRAENR